MSIRRDWLPELEAARQKLENAAGSSSRRVQFDIADYGGFRTAADTTEILQFRQDDYAADRKAGRIPASLSIDKYRRIAPYGSSYHDFGAAFDVEPTSIDGIDISPDADLWKRNPKQAQSLKNVALQILASLAPSVGLRNGASFDDIDHFELPVTLTAAKAMWGNFQETGSSYGTAGPPQDTGDVGAGGNIGGAAGDDDTQQTSRSSAGSAAVEIVGAIAIAGAIALLVRRILG